MRFALGTEARLRPADWITRLVRAGVFFALVIAGVWALHSFEASQECQGAFSRGFSNGFDLYRCDLKIRIENGPGLTLPLPI
jgi:hypothetical protein